MDLQSDKTHTHDATQQAEALLPTEWGDFLITAHADDKGDYTPHMVLRHPDLNPNEAVHVRVQLQESMKMISQHKGLLIYLRQEGRGIGIINKLKAYKHQERGLDTIQANVALGLEPDYREYDVAIAILRDLGISAIKLITNNPDKLSGLNKQGITVTERIPLIIPPTLNSAGYLETKEKMMGHLLSNQE